MRDTTMGPRFRSPLKSDIAALIEQKRATVPRRHAHELEFAVQIEPGRA
jgi:hypothetical protein